LSGGQHVRRNYARYRVLWVIWMLCVIVSSLAPGFLMAQAEEYVPALGWSDKLLHFIGYFILAFLAVRSFERRRPGIYGAMSMVVLGVALEFAQKAAPGRTTDWHDGVANALGVLCGVAAALL
jgi:VanZ family protein